MLPYFYLFYWLGVMVVISCISKIHSVTHERNLVWAQKADGEVGLGRIVGVNGDPNDWVVNRTATTRYITAPNKSWKFMALGYDFWQQTIYWSDAGNKKIQGLRLDGSNAAFTTFHGTSAAVRGLAVDWMAKNVYWTDAMYNWLIVTPARKESGVFNILIHSGLFEPNGIAVHPKKGLLFWSDSGREPKIERASCAGENRKILVNRNIKAPVGIVVDHSEERLYWVDRAKATIESVDLDGEERLTLFTVENTNFFGISLHQNFVFVTDQAEKQLYVFHRNERRHEVNFKVGSKPYDIIMYDGDLQEKIPSPCEKAGCEHLCVSQINNNYQCLCGRGYRLEDDRKSCTDDGRFGSPQYIYSIGTALCRFPGNLADMSLQNVSLDTQCFLTHRRAAMALTFNVHQDTLYFSENNTKTISRLKLREGEGPEIIIGGTGSVEGMALDWQSGNLYWTDSVFRHVMVAKSDGRFQKEVIHLDLDHPRGIAVDAINRYLYWTDVGMIPKIERAHLDGTNRKTIVQDNIGSPNHIVIDYINNMLCWTDSVFDQIECIGLAGDSYRKVIMSLPGTQIYALTIFQDYVVWTDRDKRNGIHAGVWATGEKIRGVIHPGIGKAYDVITYDESLQPLTEDVCEHSGCEQLCFPLPRTAPYRYVCGCAMGYDSSDDNQAFCDSEAIYDNFLLFSDTYQKQIYQMNLETGSFHAVPLQGHENPIAVDYDSVETRLYWTDVALKVIKRAFMNGTQEEVVRKLPENSVPDGLAVDPLSRLVYYTDTGRKIVALMTLDGKYHKVIIDRFLDQPRAIVLDPTRGHVYWTDWGLHSRIEKANMDGGERRKIVDTGLGAWPNGMAIDVLGERLYWCDARSDRIETSDLEGRGRQTLFRDEEAHFFSIAVLGGLVFYTDWTKKTIMKLQHSESKMIASQVGPPSFARLNDIQVYRSSHSIVGLHGNSCSQGNGGCSHLCIPLPQGRKCACPDDMSTLVGNRRQCIRNKEPDYGYSPTRSKLPTSEIYVPTTVTNIPKTLPTTPTPTSTHPPTTTTSTTSTTTTTIPTTTVITSTTTTSSSTTTTTITTSSTTSSTSIPTTASTPSPTTPTTRTTTQRFRTIATIRNPTTTLAAEQMTLPATVRIPTPDSTNRSKKPTTPKRSIQNTTHKATYDDNNNKDNENWAMTSPTRSTSHGWTFPSADLELSVEKVTTPHGAVTTEGYDVVTNGKMTKSETSPSKSKSAKGLTTSSTTWNVETRGPNLTEKNDTIPEEEESIDPLGDFGMSMFALLAISIGGIVLMCLIVVSAVLLYRKMDPERVLDPTRTDTTLSSISDIYEMPTGVKHVHGVGGPSCRYAALNEQFYTGDMEPGVSHESYSTRETVNTYEEILEESERSPTFSTFR